MKRLIIFPAVLAILVGGVFAWQSMSFAHLQGQLTQETINIGAAYTSIMQKDVTPLSTTYTLTDAETRLIASIQQEITTVNDATVSVENRVQGITNVQLGLSRFVNLASGSKDISADPAFTQLQTDVGQRGQVRTLLDGYNATAVMWNHGIQSDLGSLFNSIGGSQHPILPYLRFDGQQEFVPVISI